MIYYMSTKTLVKEFTNNHTPEEILECEFISFSTRVIPIRGMKKISFDQRNLFGLENPDGLDVFERKNTEDTNLKITKGILLDDSLSLSCINNVITENLVFPDKLFIILSSPNETNTGYPKYLARAITELYGFPVIDYANERYKEFTYNPKEVLKKVEKYKAKLIIEMTDIEKLLELPKKSKKKLLKAYGCWEKGLDEDEIDEIINEKNSHLPFSI